MSHVARMRADGKHEVVTVEIDPSFYDSAGFGVDFQMVKNMNLSIIATF